MKKNNNKPPACKRLVLVRNYNCKEIVNHYEIYQFPGISLQIIIFFNILNERKKKQILHLNLQSVKFLF